MAGAGRKTSRGPPPRPPVRPRWRRTASARVRGRPQALSRGEGAWRFEDDGNRSWTSRPLMVMKDECSKRLELSMGAQDRVAAMTASVREGGVLSWGGTPAKSMHVFIRV